MLVFGLQAGVLKRERQLLVASLRLDARHTPVEDALGEQLHVERRRLLRIVGGRYFEANWLRHSRSNRVLGDQ